MCGLFGFIGQSNLRSSLLLQALAIADETRGRHSTGIVAQSSDRIFMHKKALAGTRFVSEGYTEFLFETEYNIAVGHNRHATAGEINDKNAHPFLLKLDEKKWAYGCHNGIVGNKEKIAKKFKIKEHPVDSHVALNAITALVRRGAEVEDAIEEVTSFISRDADFTFIWVHGPRREVYMWRSPDRPLVIFDAREIGLGRFFCSTPEIFEKGWGSVRGALGDASKIKSFVARPYCLYKVQDDGHYEVDMVRELEHAVRYKPEPKNNYNTGGRVLRDERGRYIGFTTTDDDGEELEVVDNPNQETLTEFFGKNHHVVAGKSVNYKPRKGFWGDGD